MAMGLLTKLNDFSPRFFILLGHDGTASANQPFQELCTVSCSVAVGSVNEEHLRMPELAVPSARRNPNSKPSVLVDPRRRWRPNGGTTQLRSMSARLCRGLYTMSLVRPRRGHSMKSISDARVGWYRRRS